MRKLRGSTHGTPKTLLGCKEEGFLHYTLYPVVWRGGGTGSLRSVCTGTARSPEGLDRPAAPGYPSSGSASLPARLELRPLGWVSDPGRAAGRHWMGIGVGPPILGSRNKMGDVLCPWGQIPQFWPGPSPKHSHNPTPSPDCTQLGLLLLK